MFKFKGNTITSISDPVGVKLFLEVWGMMLDEIEWKREKWTVPIVQEIIKNTKPKGHYDVYAHALIARAEKFLKAHTIDTREVTHVILAGIERKQHPTYDDVYIVAARYRCIPMIASQLEVLNENMDYVYEKLMSHLF